MKLVLPILLSAAAPALAQNCNRTQASVSLNFCKLFEWRSADAEKNDDDEAILEMRYKSTWIEFPAQHALTKELIDGETVRMRVKGYHFPGVTEEAVMPAPTIVWEKGRVIRATLHNDIYVNPDEGNSTFLVPEEEWDTLSYEHNLHTHGLHISSDSDDQTVIIHANDSHEFNFELPANHGGGAMWYHPHIHATAEATIATAMGFIRIEDDVTGKEIPMEIVKMHEHFFVIQRMFPGKLKELSEGYEGTFDFINGEYPRLDVTDKTFALEYNTDIEDDVQFTLDNTSIAFVNGFIMPEITVPSGVWQRFKFLYFSQDDPNENQGEMMLNIVSNLDTPTASCEVHLIAKDGVYLRESRALDFAAGNKIWMHPASRSEVLVRCDILEEFEGESTDESLGLYLEETFAEDVPETKRQYEIMKIKIRRDQLTEMALEHAAEGTIAAAEKASDFVVNSCLPRYLPDMVSDDVNITFSPIAPFDEDLSEEVRDELLKFLHSETVDTFYNEVNGIPTFQIQMAPFSFNNEYFRGFTPESGAFNTTMMITGKYYQMQIVNGNHPFHIHVNHFQLQHDVNHTSGYHKKGDYMDTVSASCPSTGCSFTPEDRDPNKEHLVVRTYMDKFHGKVVMHCHVEDHADSGTMGFGTILEDTEYTTNFVQTSFVEDCPDDATVTFV